MFVALFASVYLWFVRSFFLASRRHFISTRCQAETVDGTQRCQTQVRRRYIHTESERASERANELTQQKQANGNSWKAAHYYWRARFIPSIIIQTVEYWRLIRKHIYTSKKLLRQVKQCKGPKTRERERERERSSNCSGSLELRSHNTPTACTYLQLSCSKVEMRGNKNIHSTKSTTNKNNNNNKPENAYWRWLYRFPNFELHSQLSGRPESKSSLSRVRRPTISIKVQQAVTKFEQQQQETFPFASDESQETNKEQKQFAHSLTHSYT